MILRRCEMCSMRALLKPPFPWCLELQLLQEKILNRISELGLDEQVSEMLCEMYQACFLALWFQLSLQHCAPKTNYRLARKWDAMNLQKNGSEGTNMSSIYEQSFHETCGQMNPVTWEIHAWKIRKLQSDNWTIFHWKVTSSNLNFEVAKEFGSPWFPQSSGDVPFCWGSTILEKVCRYPFDIQYTSAKTYLRNDKMKAKLTSICCCNLPSKACITRELSIAGPHVRAW